MSRVLPKMPWSATHHWRPTPLSLGVLVVALMMFGLGEALIVQAQLGASPWTVLALGIANHVPLSLGVVTFLVSVVVFLFWLPLKIKAGLGTVLNIIVIALSLDMFLWLLPVPSVWVVRLVYCVAGVVVIGIASSFYLTCQMGAGPRDGLMVGICERTLWRVNIVRTCLEAMACLVGWLLGGVVGVGTVLFAFGVGQVVQVSLDGLNRLSVNNKVD